MKTPNLLPKLVRLLAAAVVLIVLSKIVAGYVDYVPPNFSSEFLHGRKNYFFGVYHFAFYTHIASGPISLLLGTVLMSGSFRRRWPLWHRRLGRIQMVLVLLVVVPSGLWMARHAVAGPVAGAGLALLAVMTAACAGFGWRAAVQGRFGDHQRWMWRTYLLLVSAVVLRIIGGLATVAGMSAGWFNPAATWASWVVPLMAYEMRVWLTPSGRGFSK